MVQGRERVQSLGGIFYFWDHDAGRRPGDRPFLFNQPVRGYVDIVEIAITVFAFLAIAYRQKLAGHVRMEIIIGRFKGRVLVDHRGVRYLRRFIVVILMYYGWEHFYAR